MRFATPSFVFVAPILRRLPQTGSPLACHFPECGHQWLDWTRRSRKDLAADFVRRTNLAAVVIFAGLTALLTYPQVREFATSVPYHSDPYFSMWRLGWIAHAIRHAPGQAFDANIFYPEQLTLAYSDAMLLPGVVLAPLFWAGTNAVIIYNLALFAAFTLSGLTAFSLARLVTRQCRRLACRRA